MSQSMAATHFIMSYLNESESLAQNCHYCKVTKFDKNVLLVPGLCRNLHNTHFKNFLSYLTISLHRKEKPTQKTMYLQFSTYNKDHFSGDIVFLYKGQGQITDRYVASEYAISKSLCLCVNMLLRS